MTTRSRKYDTARIILREAKDVARLALFYCRSNPTLERTVVDHVGRWVLTSENRQLRFVLTDLHRPNDDTPSIWTLQVQQQVPSGGGAGWVDAPDNPVWMTSADELNLDAEEISELLDAEQEFPPSAAYAE